MGKANQIEHYAERVDAWQKAQHAAVGKARDALSAGADLVTVDKAMDNIVTKSLEGQDLSNVTHTREIPASILPPLHVSLKA